MAISTICPKCDIVILNTFCIKCGSQNPLVNKASKSKNHQDQEFSHDTVLQKIINQKKKDVKNEDEFSTSFVNYKFSFILLALFLSFVSTLYYYTLGIQKPSYVSPVIIAENSILKEVIAEVKDKFKDDSEIINLDFKTEFPEGNISNLTLYSFVPPKNQALIHISDLNAFRKDFLDDSKYDNVLKDFELKEPDLKDSFISDFLITFPEENFSEFGIIAEVKNKDLIEKKLNMYNKKFNSGTKDSIKLSSTLKSGYIYNKLVELKKDDKSRYFILLTNSKDYIDELKEASEGNLKNINNDAIFSDIRIKLQKPAHAFIYLKDKESLWPKIVTSIFDVYKDNEILDKMTKIKAKGVLIYSNDGKVNLQSQN